MDFFNIFSNNRSQSIYHAGLSWFQADRAIDSYNDAADIASANYAVLSQNAANATQYNIHLDKMDLNRELKYLSKKLADVGATQKAQGASQGFASSKADFLIANRTITDFENQILEARHNQRILQDQRRYQLRQQQAEYANRAAFARYQADMNIYKAQQQKGEALFQLGSTLFQGLFS